MIREDSVECDSGEEQSKEETTELEEQEQETVEYFPVVGSNWEMRYRDGLQKCYEIQQVRKQKAELRVQQESDNISDCHDGQWFIIGYCSVKKIPKLKRALHHRQVVSLGLCNLRRLLYPVISEFRFTTGVNIKNGQVGKR